MNKKLLEIYALAVCFCAVICFVIALGVALYDAVQIVEPALTINAHQYERLQSNEAFRQGSASIVVNGAPAAAALSEEEVTRRRQAAQAPALMAERHDGKQSLLRMLIIMLVDAGAYAVHWRIARRARQGGGA